MRVSTQDGSVPNEGDQEGIVTPVRGLQRRDILLASSSFRLDWSSGRRRTPTESFLALKLQE